MARTKKVEEKKVETEVVKQYSNPTNYSLDLLIGPVLTEKSLKLQQDQNTIVVKVSPKANKTSIMIAFEQIFNVKPLSVRIVNVLPKAKRVGRYEGKVSGYKKAYVTLSSEDKINLLNANQEEN